MSERSPERPFEGPHSITLYGDALRYMSRDKFNEITTYLEQNDIQFTPEWESPGADIPIVKEDFVDAAETMGGDNTQFFAGKVWASITGNGKLLHVVANARNDVFDSSRDFIIHEKLRQWQKDLCFNEESLSYFGLLRAYNQERLGDQGRPFAKKSYELVDIVLRNADPEKEVI